MLLLHLVSAEVFYSLQTTFYNKTLQNRPFGGTICVPHHTHKWKQVCLIDRNSTVPFDVLTSINFFLNLLTCLDRPTLSIRTPLVNTDPSCLDLLGPYLPPMKQAGFLLTCGLVRFLNIGFCIDVNLMGCRHLNKHLYERSMLKQAWCQMTYLNLDPIDL